MSVNTITRWDFTLKAEGVDREKFIDWLTSHSKKWVFQLEKGETGYEHYQGRVALKVKSRKGPSFENIHWSPTSTANKDNDFYVMKSDTRIEGPWANTDAYVPRQVRGITLKPWQQQILDDGAVWNTRNINLVYDTEGNIGKSTLAIYAGAHGIARYIPMMDSHKDYMRMIMDCPKRKLYLVDFPRAMNKVGCCSFWSAMEQVKNGHAYDDRYGFREEFFDSPNIWIFCNALPDTDVLSKDRWKVWEVIGDELKETGFTQALRCNNSCVKPGTNGAEDFDSDDMPPVMKMAQEARGAGRSRFFKRRDR